MNSEDYDDSMETQSLEEPFPDLVEIEITDIFDLHTIQPREVKAVVEEYLFQAKGKGFRSVRIIHELFEIK